MSGETGYHRRGTIIGAKIFSLLSSLGLSTYDEVSPIVAYWIEYALTEQSVDTGDLVERLSLLAWENRSSEANAAVAKFLKEFRDAPHRSEQARSCVDRLCDRVLRWFAAAAAENLVPWDGLSYEDVARYRGNGFTYAASFVGHLTECGILDHDLVRKHLIKPLITHRCTAPNDVGRFFRSMAIYQIFVAARDTLLQGFLEPEDVEACFKTFGANPPPYVAGPDAAKLNEFREFHATWLERKEEEQRAAAAVQEPEGEVSDGTVAAEVTAEVETPVAPAPQDLPIAMDTGFIPSIFHGIDYPSALLHSEPPPRASTNNQNTAPSSPTLSISTVSDLTTTELDDVTEEGDVERIPTRHQTFYLEDGNVEVVCGHTIFRIHSPVVSFSSPTLRDLLSPSTLLNASMPGGCPRIFLKDNADDFAVLLKMIYTPGFPARRGVPEFTIFAPLLRMTTKYGFPDVREQLVEEIRGAYPTKWEDFQAAVVLGEDVFGSPKPHPNAVLNLLMEQNIKFALPFAAYQVGLRGFPALVGDEPSTVLPLRILLPIIHGMGIIRRMSVVVAQRTAYVGDLGVCPDLGCILSDGTNHKVDTLNKVFNLTLGGNGGDPLFPLSLGTTIVCANCAARLEKVHRGFRKLYFWTVLPRLLGWESWEGV